MEIQTMTGEQLLKKLQALTPEQLKFGVYTRAEDVGRWRSTVYSTCDRIVIHDVPNEKGEELKGLVIL